MAGQVAIKVTIAGVTQFVSTSPIATFSELTGINTSPPSAVARIMGYSYNAGAGAAHAVRLVMTPSNATTGGDEDIILEDRASVTSVGNFCGPSGIVVPRRYGLEATAQPPASPADTIISAETYQLFFSTTGKAADATFYVWYQIEGLDGNS